MPPHRADGQVSYQEFKNLKNETREIYKDPVTDDGTKKSAKGLLYVGMGRDGIYLRDQASWEDVHDPNNLLQVVFRDGELVKEWTLDEIRERIKNPHNEMIAVDIHE